MKIKNILKTKFNKKRKNAFTIVELVAINSSVKSPTIRAFVTRNVESGRYAKVGTIKYGKRGKPATLFRLNKTA